jgi:hypothetical protein
MPPKGIAFKETPSGGGAGSAGPSRLDIVANASGAYSCTPPSTGSETSPRWSCQRLRAVSAATRNKIFGFYTRELDHLPHATDPTSFEIKSYSASPPASLFELPPSAMVMSIEAAGHS